MARVTVEDCLKNVDSRFTLVHLAVRRVLQLRSGLPLAIENLKGNKEVVTALREIASGKITTENIRLVEESRPALPEVVPPAVDLAVTAELKEILDEATSFSPSIAYEGSEEVSEQDLDKEVEDRGEEE